MKKKKQHKSIDLINANETLKTLTKKIQLTKYICIVLLSTIFVDLIGKII